MSFVSPDVIRAEFSKAMSAMYQTEVPAYGELLQLVDNINQSVLHADPSLKEQLQQTENLSTLSEQRHGAIRLGKASELAMMRRLFAIMGMHAVGYYDLSVAGIPVHSTAFRPIEAQAIRENPFRIFTSLLRLDLISDQALRQQAETILNQRNIFSPEIVQLIELAEQQNGLTSQQAQDFIQYALAIFRWHEEANVDESLYQSLLATHPLIADVVSFKGPHINHLTPRTLDIDQVQPQIHTTGAKAKTVIEGPPKRQCPILLRQTAFVALEEKVLFQGKAGTHTARFGEIEQRGCALTPKGRALYDQILQQVREHIKPKADGSNIEAYKNAMQEAFTTLPDDYQTMREQKLAYFKYSLTALGMSSISKTDTPTDLESLIAKRWIRFDPITYEDFLPVSAAGIFQSNLGEKDETAFGTNPNQSLFEEALGSQVLDEFELYAAIQQQSIKQCFT